jgi:2,4-dienoyl-CoA reductase-like NADH-dependent reductase (Old Yellow Enzyme family)
MNEETRLFSTFSLRSIMFSNRIAVSPMCEYSSEDGFANDWHLVHLGSRAVGGAGLVITEAAAISPEGRITPQDLGLWKDAHIVGLRRIVDFLHLQGARAGVQLAHAGRKASMTRPWDVGAAGEQVVPSAKGGWENVVAPSALAFNEGYARPVTLDRFGIHRIVEDFTSAARRALEAGFDVLELHAAHGYLLHQFLSPLSNRRTDEFGGSFENRVRLTLNVVEAVRAEWPEELPLLVRISATDWADGGWNIDESVELARLLQARGVDMIDVSSGGLVPGARIPAGPGYQVPFAERIRRESGIATGAVGMITDAEQADQIVRNGQADIVLLAREMLRDPYWPLHAAAELNETISWTPQYLRAAPRGSTKRTPMSPPISVPTK